MAEQTFLDRVRNTIRRNEGQPSTRNAAQWFRTKLRGLRGQLRNHGFAYAGPRMKNAFQFGLFSGPYINGTGVPVSQWGNYHLSGMLDSTLNGTVLTLGELISI